MINSAAIRSILTILLLALPSLAQYVPSTSQASATWQKTLFVNCRNRDNQRRVFSPVSLSEGGKWRAYAEVDVEGNHGCLQTTRLFVAHASSAYRLVYLMPPKRTAQGNGMEILGWARNSRMLLVMIEEWQHGSDAPDTQQVLAIDAGTGMVYEPNLEEMLQDRKGKQCMFRVTEAGFSANGNVDILVRARFSTWLDVDENLEEVPRSKRCGNAEETWSFNFANGEIKRVGNTQQLQVFRRFLPNRNNK